MTTIDMRRTHDRDLLTPRENSQDENGSEEVETPEARSPKENYHH
jgi:hypothetical protein